MIDLDQAFYGRDSIRGYRLLASSNPHHNNVVERLCAAIGTPDGTSILEPFYINYIENGFRFMISCVPGFPDDNGRKTLFFHAFIGQHHELLNSEFGIGDLIQNNAFISSYKTGPVLPTSFEETATSLPWGKTSFVWDRQDLAIQSSKPELSTITGLLKDEIDNVSWASFTFRPLSFCKLYVISQYVAMPQDTKCVNMSGEIQNPSTKHKSMHLDSAPPMALQNQNKKTIPILFCVSLIMNVILAFVVLGRSSKKMNNTHENENHIEQTTSQQTSLEETENSARETVIKELREKFEKDYSYQSYKEWKQSLQENSKSLKKADELNDKPLLKAGEYIRFVNQTLFEEKGDN